MFFFGDQHKGNDECVKDFWNGCCDSSMFDGLRIISWMCNVLILRREYLLHRGSFEGFGNNGILENIIDYTHQSYPESLSGFWEEPCDVVKFVSRGFMLLGYELPLSLSNQLTPREDIKRETDPLWSIELKQ